MEVGWNELRRGKMPCGHQLRSRVNPAHAHLILNHLPQFGSLFVTALLVVSVVRQSSELARVALYFAVATSLFAIPTFITGQYSEEIAESLPEVSEFIMEDHEDAALFALVGLELCGTFALWGLIAFRQAEIPKWIVTGVLVGFIISFGLTAWTAHLGGQIRHTETRSDFR